MGKKVVEITINGPRPTHPKDMVLAMEAIAKELTPGPADGAMALLVAFVHLHRAYIRPDMDEAASIGTALGSAMACVDQWWPDAREELREAANDDTADTTRH